MPLRLGQEVQGVLREGVVSDAGAAPGRPAATALPWYGDGLRFQCTQCGNCCSGAPGYVWVTPAETQPIAEFLGLTVAEFLDRHTRRTGSGRRSLLEKRDGDCEFLVRSGGRTLCSIHPVRPVQCRTWPFWKSNLRSPETWAATGQHCPGIDKGPLHNAESIEAALRENGSRPL